MDERLEFARAGKLSIAFALFLSAGICSAENPYATILPRNAFGIKDPPPPLEPPPPLPPPKAPANVFLTGMAEFNDGMRVYLMVNRTGAKIPDYLSLREGERQDDIEVVQIDGPNETVRIRNSGVESSLNFRDNANKAAAAPNVPTPPTPGGNQPANVAVQNPQPQAGPVVIGRGGVLMSGGNSGYAPAMNPAPAATGGNVYGAGTYNAPNSTPTRTLPVRAGNQAPTDSGGLEVPAGNVITHPRTGRQINIPPAPIPGGGGGLPSQQ